ncbi:MAG: ABC transporter substrate-binding protein [Proteobacteria bacterium]|nr:ABC transporter substrate-binding protein [Pseudomonadota bacterium]MBU4295958.1 ABC transporter substrate-binding protein [Pseudomonadota bacterium]MCG2746168.1 ABC transporter substrate-binding protein [Desulfobulbaceae bacterium]
MKLKVLIGILLCWFVFPFLAQCREIIDMSGRTVTIPDTISKVVAVSPPGTYLLYAIDPTVIAGLNFPLWKNEQKYTPASLGKLPVIGGLVGQGRTLNREVLLQVKPDFVLFWAWRDDAVNRKFETAIDQLDLSRVSVRLDSIDDYPAALLFLADVLGKKERGEMLYRYAMDTLREAKAAAARISPADKVTVYYAEGPDGLGTERATSLHAELIPLAGGVNVHQGEELDHYGMEKVSMEQVLMYDPEVILVKEKSFFDTVFADPRWQNIRAVRDRRVYLIPYVPFNWFDRPPSFMRLLGIKWLMHTLHPDLYQIDMQTETRSFYKLFLGVDLSEKEAREVLNL